MRIYRNNLGQFSTKEKATKYQDDWGELKEWKREIPTQFTEYSYFISVSLETRKDHRFHTEFQITSPIKLYDSDIRRLLLSRYNSGKENYSQILKQEECEYETHEEHTYVNERPHIHIERTESISRK